MFLTSPSPLFTSVNWTANERYATKINCAETFRQLKLKTSFTFGTEREKNPMDLSSFFIARCNKIIKTEG